jgi:hypothetical protein
MEIECWYRDRLSKADVELRLVEEETITSTRTVVWNHLQINWRSEISKMKRELSREIVQREEVLLHMISDMEPAVNEKPEKWKYCPDYWTKLETWRQELQSLERCVRL